MKQLISRFILVMSLMILASSASFSVITNNTISGNLSVCTNSSSILISGSVPNGVNGTFVYRWLSSEFSFDGGYIVATGFNNFQNYYTQSLSTTTWFKRVVISGSDYDTSLAMQISVLPKPTVSFLINKSGQCVYENSFNFTNNSTISLPHSITSFTWDLGNGDTSNLTSISNKKYSGVGTYSVKLIARSNNGCVDSFSNNVSLYPRPLSRFTVDNSSQCVQGKGFTFNNTSSIALPYYVNSYLWDFGNGDTASQTFVYAKKYNTAGVYKVKLIAKANNGCVDTSSTSLVINPKPDATVSFSGPTTFCQGDTVILSVPKTSGCQYSWPYFNFHELGGYDSSKYLAKITENVKVVVTNSFGCKDSSYTQVTVKPKPNIRLFVGYATLSSKWICYNDSVKLETYVDYISSSVTNAFQWRKNKTLMNYSNPHIMLYDSGIYDVIVTNSLGCTSTSSEFEVKEQIPNTKITVIGSTAFCKGDSVTLKGPKDWPYSYMWYKDGSYFAGPSDSIVQVKIGGKYKLKVTSLYNCVDSSSNLDVVEYQIPEANITYKDASHICPNQSLTLQAGYQPGFLYSWYKDGVKLSETSNTLTTQLEGKYAVKVVDADLNECTSELMSVSNAPKPKIGFNPNTSIDCMNGKGFNFINTSTTASPDYIVKYTWNFGDGDTSNQSFIYAKKYANPGKYKVSLRAQTVFGCVDSNSQNVFVGSIPQAFIDYNGPLSFCEGKELILSTPDTIEGIRYNWIKDGSLYAKDTNAIKLIASGNYVLNAIDTNYCIGISKLMQVTINKKPLPISISGLSDVKIQNYQNYNVPATNGSTYTWLLTKGTGSSISNTISILWTAIGIDTLKVVETSFASCVGDTAYKAVNISKATGIQSLSNSNDLYIYPNPSNGVFELNKNQNTSFNIEVYNSIGELVYENVLSVNNKQIDLKHLPHGLYYLKLNSADDEVKVFKVIIE